MSWRSTISSHGPVEIYQDIDTGEICVFLDMTLKKNDKYDDPIVSLGELKLLHEEIGKFLIGGGSIRAVKSLDLP